MVFHWSLSDSKYPQASNTRLRILNVFSNPVIWKVSIRPPTFKSSKPYNNPLVIVPKEPITIGTILTFMFHSFFNSLARSRYLSFFSHSFRFILWPTDYYCYHYYNTFSRVFHTSVIRGFHTELSGKESLKSPGFFPIFYLILTMPWIGWFSFVFFSKSSSPCINLFRNCTRNSNYNWYDRHFHILQFFSSLSRSRYLYLLYFFLISENSTIQKGLSLFFLLSITRFGLLSEIKWSMHISKSQKSLCFSFLG